MEKRERARGETRGETRGKNGGRRNREKQVANDYLVLYNNSSAGTLEHY